MPRSRPWTSNSPTRVGPAAGAPSTSRVPARVTDGQARSWEAGAPATRGDDVAADGAQSPRNEIS